MRHGRCDRRLGHRGRPATGAHAAAGKAADRTLKDMWTWVPGSPGPREALLFGPRLGAAPAPADVISWKWIRTCTTLCPSNSNHQTNSKHLKVKDLVWRTKDLVQVRFGAVPGQ